MVLTDASLLLYPLFCDIALVPGYKPRLLAVRTAADSPISSLAATQLSGLRRLFWFFTMTGLSLPFRIWFERRCDYLRVVVVKEASSSYSSSADATNIPSGSSSGSEASNSWFSIPKSYYSYWTSSTSSTTNTNSNNEKNEKET